MSKYRKFSDEVIVEIVSRYLNREDPVSLTKEYGIQHHTLLRYLKSAGVKERYLCFRKLPEEKERECAALYDSGIPSPELSKQFGVSIPTVLKYARLYGRGTRTISEAKRIYQVNEKFFEKIDTFEKAYVLGFMAADGSVKDGEISFNLCTKDEDHLFRIRSLLKSEHPIKREITPEGHLKSRLLISSVKMAEDLLYLGIVENKTYLLEMPDVPYRYMSPFLLGMIDGDGGFYPSLSSWTKKDGTRSAGIEFSLTATVLFLEFVQDFFQAQFDFEKVKLKRVGDTGAVACLQRNGNRQTLRFANFLYRDATIYLPRKRDIVLNHYRDLPKYRDRLEFA